MAHAAPSTLASLRARKLQAEKALRSAQLRNLRARVALLASTGAGAVARRMVVELSEREVQKAAAEVDVAAEALAAADPRQIPLTAWTAAAPARRREGATPGHGPGRAPAAEAAEPLLAWARSHGAGVC